MDQNAIIDQLEELIKSFGVQIRREPIRQDEDLIKVVGGLCLLRGEYVLTFDIEDCRLKHGIKKAGSFLTLPWLFGN